MPLAMAAVSPVAAEPTPPRNPALAASTWPIYHADTYATAAVRGVRAIMPSASESVGNLTHRRVGRGTVSPWTVLRAPEANGDQVVLTSPLSGVAKYMIGGGALRPVGHLRLDRNWSDFDWTIAVLADGSAVTTEKKMNRFAIVGDATRDPASPLVVLRRIAINADLHGRITSHFSIAYDGTLIALTQTRKLLAVDLRKGEVKASYELPGADSAAHNSFPIDETGRIYVSAQDALIAIDWTGSAFREAWRAPYDMRGPGCDASTRNRRPFREFMAVARGETCTGSGTTPTLVGSRKDGIVVIVDGHAPRNNLVAFWRGEIPEDWKPLPAPDGSGRLLDRRVAGVLPLPLSTPEGRGFTAENSPAAYGNQIVVAQWAGFSPGADPASGVQRVDWDRAQRRFKLIWANPAVHMNGVPTIGLGSRGPVVFGMGRAGARYIYSTLDLDTGQPLAQLDLGTSDDVLDQGNNHAIAADGSIIYGGKRNLMRLRGR
jgi:outer membrane protein assembly factor BamB